jgi:hypothetical protein
MRRTLPVVLAALIALTVATLVAVVPASSGAGTPLDDAFYQYTGATPLAQIRPGTVLKTRTLPYHIIGLALPIQTTQLLYRTTSQIGTPEVSVTSVIKPLAPNGTPKLIAYGPRNLRGPSPAASASAMGSRTSRHCSSRPCCSMATPSPSPTPRARTQISRPVPSTG